MGVTAEFKQGAGAGADETGPAGRSGAGARGQEVRGRKSEEDANDGR